MLCAYYQIAVIIKCCSDFHMLSRTIIIDEAFPEAFSVNFVFHKFYLLKECFACTVGDETL